MTMPIRGDTNFGSHPVIVYIVIIAIVIHSYCLVWATKLLLAAMGLVFPALVLGYKSFNCSMYQVPVPTLIEKFV